MSLFKKRLLTEYNPIYNEGKKMYLQTLLNEQIRAPFNASVGQDTNKVTLSTKNIKMVITNILVSDIKGTVREGDVIGVSMNGRINGKSAPHIGVEILKDDIPQDVLFYLFGRDADEPKEEADNVIEVEAQEEKPSSKTVSIETQQKKTKKSSSAKK
jgi:hypothetical protein